MGEQNQTGLRTLLVDPEAYFAAHEPKETLFWAAGVVALSIVVVMVAIAAIPTILGGAIEGPITVENPDRPPEAFCDDGESTVPDEGTFDCDEPATIERSPESVLREVTGPFYLSALVGLLLLWGAGAVAFNVMARLLGGMPSLSGTAALAGWVALVELVRVPLGIALLGYAVSDVTITDPEAQIDVLVGATRSVEPYLALVTLLGAVWQWYIVTGGLQHDADLSRGAAGVAAAVPLVISVLLAIV